MSGVDDKGSVYARQLIRYASIDEMWQIELHNQESKHKVVEKVGSVEQWYNNANQYWSKAQPTYDGILGGYGNLSAKDIKFSLTFLLSVVKLVPQFKREAVLDCGAGIGRISKDLLCQTFKTVDIVDQCENLVVKAKQILKEKKNMRHFYVKGLQQFEFEEKYDCIWVQWVFSHLNDEHAVVFLQKARAALAPGGIIMLKQNHCKFGFVVDKEDFSVTRSVELYKILFQKAGLKIIKEETQNDWPEDLFGVRMYALA